MLFNRQRDSDPAGCFGTLLVVLVFAIFLAWIAGYVLLIIGAVILAVSVLVGAIITLRNYFVALGGSIKKYRGAIAPSKIKIPNFLYRWWMVCLDSVKNSWLANVSGVKYFASKIGGYKLLSFGKWFCLFTLISLALFGSVVSLAILLAHIVLFLILGYFAFEIFLVLAAVFLFVGAIMSVIFAVQNYLSRMSESYNAKGTVFFDYIFTYAFKDLIEITKNYFYETKNRVLDQFAKSQIYLAVSIQKWFYLGTAIMQFPIGILFWLLFIVLEAVILVPLFIVAAIIKLIKR